ncbi:hypothetical protein ZPAH1_orf00070 [Aeromonas phage ZPAH1]|nr:hypothetical protein ZPAH1_orf00070 [Aeromonas phage ZPAH1]
MLAKIDIKGYKEIISVIKRYPTIQQDLLPHFGCMGRSFVKNWEAVISKDEADFLLSVGGKFDAVVSSNIGSVSIIGCFISESVDIDNEASRVVFCIDHLEVV